MRFFNNSLLLEEFNGTSLVLIFFIPCTCFFFLFWVLCMASTSPCDFFPFQLREEFSAMERDFCPLLRGPYSDPEGLAAGLETRLQSYVSEVKSAQSKIQEMITKAEVASKLQVTVPCKYFFLLHWTTKIGNCCCHCVEIFNHLEGNRIISFQNLTALDMSYVLFFIRPCKKKSLPLSK